MADSLGPIAFSESHLHPGKLAACPTKGLVMYCFATEWILTPYRLAVHGPTRTAVIADPHLGYSDARRRAGDAVPDVSLDVQLAPLTRACAALELNGLVVAGDLCEARL